MSEITCLSFLREPQLFSERSSLMTKLAHDHQRVLLTADELLHPTEPAEFVVRLGKLRVSQFLSDGREITRAVLQAGTCLRVFVCPSNGPKPGDDIYLLSDIVLMALGEVELWRLPPGSLEN